MIRNPSRFFVEGSRERTQSGRVVVDIPSRASGISEIPLVRRMSNSVEF
jgi:hypothetical protein